MLPDGASLQRTKASATQLYKMIGNEPNIEYFFNISGVDLIGGGRKTNAGTVYIPLKDWDKRREHADAIARKFGGMGMMEDFPIQRFWRDARIERIWEGTSEIHRDIIAKDILRPYRS